MKKFNANVLEISSLCILFAFLILIKSANKFLFFRDYAIIWEGAYRISLGQIPYTDFGIPVGPVSFMAPALAFKIFGATWRVLELTQLFLNGVILLTCYSILKKISNNSFEIIFSLALLTFFYLTFLVSPWYNSTALLFFLVTIRLAFNKDGLSHALTGACSALTILTKQDYGLICLFGSIFILVLRNLNEKSIIISKSWCVLQFFIGFSSVFLVLFAVVNLDDFLYWFNYGQGKYEKRRIPIEIFLNPRFLLLCFIVYIYIKTREIFWVVSALIISTSLLTSYTSGLIFTSYFDIVIFPGIVYRSYKNCYQPLKFMNVLLGLIFLCVVSFWKLPMVFQLSMVMCLLLISSFLKQEFFYLGGATILLAAIIVREPIGGFGEILTSVSKGLPGDAYFNYKNVTLDVIAAPKSLPAFSNTFAPKDTYDGIGQLKITLQESNLKSNSIKVLNLSELTPLYAEMGLIPQRGLPLWFHTGVIFPKGEQMKLLNDIKVGKFDLIIYQEAHDFNSPIFSTLYLAIKESGHYKEPNFSSFKSPSGAFSSCGVRKCEDANISVFIKSD